MEMTTFLETLVNQFPHMYPEVLALKGIPQDANHHPEGDAFIHTALVTDEAIRIATNSNLTGFGIQVLIYAAVCHDLGKVSTTEIHPDGRITAYGHPDESVPIAETLLHRLQVPDDIIAHVLPLIREHMCWVGFYMSEITNRAVKRLARRLLPSSIEMVMLLIEADMSGRLPLPKGLPQRAYDILIKARQLGVSEGIEI